jgi:hypothetical protein
MQAIGAAVELAELNIDRQTWLTEWGRRGAAELAVGLDSLTRLVRKTENCSSRYQLHGRFSKNGSSRINRQIARKVAAEGYLPNAARPKPQ